MTIYGAVMAFPRQWETDYAGRVPNSPEGWGLNSGGPCGELLCQDYYPQHLEFQLFTTQFLGFFLFGPTSAEQRMSEVCRQWWCHIGIPCCRPSPEGFAAVQGVPFRQSSMAGQV